ncbi:hypothetical protein ACF0H5_002383 [Mactra antiquata]
MSVPQPTSPRRSTHRQGQHNARYRRQHVRGNYESETDLRHGHGRTPRARDRATADDGHRNADFHIDYRRRNADNPTVSSAAHLHHLLRLLCKPSVATPAHGRRGLPPRIATLQLPRTTHLQTRHDAHHARRRPATRLPRAHTNAHGKPAYAPQVSPITPVSTTYQPLVEDVTPPDQDQLTPDYELSQLPSVYPQQARYSFTTKRYYGEEPRPSPRMNLYRAFMQSLEEEEQDDDQPPMKKTRYSVPSDAEVIYISSDSDSDISM